MKNINEEKGNLSQDDIPASRTMSEKKIWFIRKRYGWGWMPSPKTWQGWVVIVAFALLTGLLAQYITGPVEAGEIVGNEATVRIIIFSVALAVEIYYLFRISYKYGEELRWQWGGVQKKTPGKKK